MFVSYHQQNNIDNLIFFICRLSTETVMMHRILIVEVSFILLVFFPFMESIVVPNFTLCLDTFYLREPPKGFNNPNTIDICVNTDDSNGEYYYAIKYDLYMHIPLYAAYQVNSFSGNVRRSTTWRMENDLPTKQQNNTYFQASVKDYNRSTYDRGHLFPALYNQDSTEKMFSTFTLINAAPMSKKLNRGPWKTVESITLRLLNDSCTFPGAKRFVITGTVPGENRTKNATDGINIPKLVWNAIYCYSSHAEEMLEHTGWSRGHLANQTGLGYRTVSIGELNSILTEHMSVNHLVELFHINP
jgi:DNA/RNA endonuclease G (NUC1)